MPESKVFLSYSHLNKKYLEELRRVLETVPGIDEVLWFDEKEIGIGDKFHPAILQAMDALALASYCLALTFFVRTTSSNMNCRICCAELSKGVSNWPVCMSRRFPKALSSAP
jgi:hypothetical protein